MSKINTVRLINVNYNNNAIRISDETFHLNGESTLLSLRNGGGKSVLVQMISAPFVHKRYRDAKDRPFESYFTSSKPSFILVEWVLDQGAGYVLTGMMVRQSNEAAGQMGENLEMIHFISEYQESCSRDICSLPVVEKKKKEIKVKNFASCCQLFEGFKKEKPTQFFYYDMANGAQARQYFDKLQEYQIYSKEWETIIKKVNLKESGLSDLFADSRDEKGLVEKWFLESVESKLNRESSRMKEFQNILEKYAGQYKDNQSKIKRRDTIRRFKEEASRIQEKASIYQEISAQEKKQENQVIGFITELDSLWKKTKTKHSGMLAEIEAIKEAAARVEYEKLSAEIYELLEQERYHSSNREMISMEQDELEHEAKEIEKHLHLLLCAKQQKAADENKNDLELVRQKLLISRKKDEDLEPERNRLGYLLKCHYEGALEVNRGKKEKNQKSCLRTAENLAQEKEKTGLLQKKLLEAASRQGALKSKAESYSQKEESYNTRYGEVFIRNILGEYEPGILEIREQSYKQELEACIRERTRKKKQLEDSHKEQKQLKRTLDDVREEQIHKKADREKNRQLEEKYQAELEERSVILRYLGMEQSELYDMEKILQISGKKLREIESIRRSLEKEEDELQKEYSRLTQGKVLELPEEFERELENLGIHAVFGMEWLKKNGYSEKENQKQIINHPFLPYALILSQRELEKLSRQAGNIYTSFPIPIIVREQLEDVKGAKAGSIHTFPGVSFYVLFNENLLDEEKLAAFTAEKEKQIKKKQEAIKIRHSEYREYFERQERVKNQAVTKERYAAVEEALEAADLNLSELDEKYRNTAHKLAMLESRTAKLEIEIHEAGREIERQQRRMEDYVQLCGDYEAYLICRKELERCIEETKQLEEQQKLSRMLCERLQEQQNTLETEKDGLEQESAALRECRQKYQLYKKPDSVTAEESPSDTAEEMEARYKAVTSAMSQEIHELEEQERKAAKHYEDLVEELEHLKGKYRLRDGEWLETRYSRKEESRQEVLLEDKRLKIENKKMLWNEADKKIAVIVQQAAERREKMHIECGQEKLLPKEEIKNRDFDARKNQLYFQEKEAQKNAEKLKMRLQSYEENLTALSEYKDLQLQEPVIWEQSFEEMNSQELRNFKGILIRDYNQKGKEKQEAREQLRQVLNQIVRMDLFGEDYYRGPLESMLELSYDADLVLLQLNTTVQSYDSLMEKLEVDLSVLEKEKERIMELLEDYIREVHQNLGKIDRNSTITIRERPVKMLKLKLPEWEENESLYRIHLKDFIEEITKKGIRIFEQNENAQEYFGTQITTRNLYDTVVGIGNVQIHLYKIEEQREYAITWAQVAKNSGGEGFLSAFVILSSLLYYMRKDDSDIFAERNEGKVLLMDNPFAQTNASHLLKPLMDMARKTNTQLICLTGLGGESIYNRFDNIYVLNLIAASLREGMQYLKADHLRGDEPETIEASRIQVIEQQELLF